MCFCVPKSRKAPASSFQKDLGSQLLYLFHAALLLMTRCVLVIDATEKQWIFSPQKSFLSWMCLIMLLRVQFASLSLSIYHQEKALKHINTQMMPKCFISHPQICYEWECEMIVSSISLTSSLFYSFQLKWLPRHPDSNGISLWCFPNTSLIRDITDQKIKKYKQTEGPGYSCPHLFYSRLAGTSPKKLTLCL